MSVVAIIPARGLPRRAGPEAVAHVDGERSADIDTFLDWDFLEFLVTRGVR